MKIIIKILTFTLLFTSNFLFAVDTLTENKNHDLYRILKDADLKNRLLIIEKELIDYNVTKVPYKDKKSTDSVYIPILSYLLLNGFIEEAIYLVQNDKLKPFESFSFSNNEMSDIIIAYENNIMDFIRVAVPKIENINKQFTYNGEKGFTLLMLAAVQQDEYTYEKTEILIEKKINTNLQSFNNLTAIMLADLQNNRDFIEAYYTTQKLLFQKVNILLTNTELSPKNKIDQKLLLEDIKNGKLESVKNYNSLFKKWTQLIVLGYNDVADEFYNKLLTFEEFDINGTTDSGLSPIIATAISNLGGGNVEYANKLLELGADHDISKDGLNIPMMAIKRDNHKILALLFSKGLFLEDSLDLYKMALFESPKAIKSAYTIKRTIEKITNN